ncbi:fibronectin type III domain-containing protein [Tamlana sp. I1]|uniref:fibronectin type III domain-containing protein n=1 Tax=Tamlana sp. I1 TaxID=2762061 RepID=UPI00188F084D|nr:fibronectin type III domain-containing protein [Tamlana sp. I1]
MMKKTTFLILFSLIFSLSYGQWKPINPGAGGQVQDIVSDPNTEGRLILASDMEGIYESLDHGESWHAMGHLHQNRVYAVAFAPGNANKLYVGTLYGLEVSNDGGATFSLVPGSKRKSIGAIAVDPNNTDVIIAGIGWRDDYDFSDNFGLPSKFKGEIFRSTDGGATWANINFDQDANSDPNVFTIQFDETDGNIVYLSSGKGLFKSMDAGLTWVKIDGPTGTQKNKGASLSPDGKILYAAYTTTGKQGWIYATPTSAINWQKVADGTKETLNNINYWYPEVDSRSVGGEHKVIFSLEGHRDGLFEGTFSWNGDVLTEYSWKNVWKGTEGYDNGWDNAAPNPRFAHYTPKSWDRAIWSTTNQTIFQGKPSGDTFTWHNRYSIPNLSILVSHWGQDWPTYSGRGTESTYTYDIAVHENYVVQGQADNGAMESWDYGFSWSNIKHRSANPPLSDVQAVDIAMVEGTAMVVAQMTSGYGGNAKGAGLYAKKLSTHSPEDPWLYLGGGWKGLPPGVLRDIAVSPADPKRVFTFSSGQGLWMMNDIGWAYNTTEQGQVAWWSQINKDDAVTAGVNAVKKIAPHPTNKDIVYFNGASGSNQGVFKGEFVADGEPWKFTKIYNGAGWDSEIVAWESNGQVYLFFSGKSNENGDGSNYIGALSLDEGQTWKTVITKDTAKGLNTPDWYSAIADDFNFTNKGGAAGYGNQIIMSYYDHRMQQTYGIYKGTIDGSGDVTWENWTGDIHFGGLTSAIVKEEAGVPYVFASTAGAGAWKRPLNAGAVIAKPAAPSGLTTEAISGTEIKLTWVDNSDNETGFRVQRMQDGTYINVGSLAADATMFTDEDLAPSTQYTYRVIAINDGGESAPSDVAMGTTTDEVPACKSENIVVNSEFDTGINNWVFYKNDGAGVDAELAIVSDGGLSGDKSAKVTVNSALTGEKDSDIQLWNNIPDLEKGKTYQYTFMAKSTASRTIRASVLKGEAPWTTYSSEEVTLTNEASTYGPFEFTMGETGTALRLDFLLSKSGETVWIDNVILQVKCEDDNTGGEGAPDAPSELKATVVSSSAINLSWTDNSDDETGFKVERKKGNGDFETISTVGENGTSYPSEGLEAGTTYTYRVKAVNLSGESVYSNEVTATTSEGNTNSCNEKNWVPNGEFDKGDVDWDFYVNSDTSAKAIVKTVMGEPGLSGDLAIKLEIETGGVKDADIQFKSLLPTLEKGMTYQLTFMAKAEAKKTIRVATLLGEAPWSNFLEETIEISTEAKTYGPFEFTMENETSKGQFHFFVGADNIDLFVDKVAIKEQCDIVAVVPNAPTNLAAAVQSDTQIDLTWTDNADNETSYILERKSTGAFETIATINANTIFYSDTSVEAGTAYTYRLSAKNDTGTSDYSNEAMATTTGNGGDEGGTCANPNLAPNGDFDKGDVDWDFYNNTGGIGEVKTVMGEGLSGELAISVSTDEAGAKDSDVQFKTLLPTLEKGKTYELSFMAKADAAKDIRVAVLLGEAPWTNFVEENLTITTSVATYGPFEFTMDMETSKGQFHFFLGNDNTRIILDNVIIQEKCPEIPSIPKAPSNLLATMGSATQINLTWTDNSKNETGFIIERKSDGDFAEIATVDANTTMYESTGLIPETEYTYRVKAINDLGASAFSNESSDVTDSESGISFNNFDVESISETCTGKNNGQISIVTKKRFDYTTTIAGVDYSFDDTLVVDDLAPGTYEFCIEIASENFEQCFSVIITSGAQTTGKMYVNDKKLEVDMTAGTAPYDVVINGESAFKTSSSKFSVDVKHGDKVTIKTSKSCEGVLSKEMDIIKTLKAYPNPTTDVFEVAIPSDDETVVVQITNLQSQVVFNKTLAVQSGRVKVNVADQAEGVYLVKVQLKSKPVTFKLIKK